MSKPPGQMSHKEVQRAELAAKRQAHADLDAAISALESQVNPDRLMIQRLKRQKLALKDEIRQLSEAITPDIIA